MPLRQFAALAAVLIWTFTPAAHAVPVVPVGYTIDLYATGIGAVTGLSFAPDGSLIATDYAGGRILKVGTDGSLQTLATGLTTIENIAYKSDGSLFAVTSTSGTSTVVQIAGNGTATPYASGFSYPTSMDVWNDELYLSNSGNGTISKIDAQGNVTTVLTTPSAPNGPFGISFDAAGTMHYIDHGTGNVYAYDFTTAPQIAGHVTPYGGTYTGTGFGGQLFATDVNLGTLVSFDTNGTAIPFATGFAGKSPAPAIGPNDFIYDGVNTLYVGDGNNIWRISAPVPVPEPGTLALFAIGLPGVWRRRFKER